MIAIGTYQSGIWVEPCGFDTLKMGPAPGSEDHLPPISSVSLSDMSPRGRARNLVPGLEREVRAIRCGLGDRGQKDFPSRPEVLAQPFGFEGSVSIGKPAKPLPEAVRSVGEVGAHALTGSETADGLECRLKGTTRPNT